MVNYIDIYIHIYAHSEALIIYIDLSTSGQILARVKMG